MEEVSYNDDLNPSQALDEAWCLFHTGNYGEAEVICRNFLSQEKDNNEIKLCLAHSVDNLNRKDEAYILFQEIIAQEPDNIAANAGFSGFLYERQDYDEALKFAEMALAKDGDYLMALVNKANILDAKGQSEESLIYYQKAIAVDTSYVVAHINMAGVLFGLKRYDEAIAACEKAISINDTDSSPFITAGSCYEALNDFEQAIAYYKKAEKLDSGNSSLKSNLAGAYEKNRDYENALIYHWEIVLADTDDIYAHLNFGYLLYSMVSAGKADMAKKNALKWKNQFPNNSVAEHMAAAVSASKVPKKASNDYVRKLFDVFASDFDNNLEALEYKAPEFIGRALTRFFNKPENKFVILDAGCGTGLCGAYLKPFAVLGGLEGVDLSQGMLEKAALKNIYDRLHEAEIISFLSTIKAKYDIIASADVFTYFGDFKPLFSVLSGALKKDGVLFFTATRRLKKSPVGYALNASGRYSHNLDYILLCLESNGFKVELIEDVILRKEAGDPVYGFVITAIKV